MRLGPQLERVCREKDVTASSSMQQALVALGDSAPGEAEQKELLTRWAVASSEQPHEGKAILSAALILSTASLELCEDVTDVSAGGHIRSPKAIARGQFEGTNASFVLHPATFGLEATINSILVVADPDGELPIPLVIMMPQQTAERCTGGEDIAGVSISSVNSPSSVNIHLSRDTSRCGRALLCHIRRCEQAQLCDPILCDEATLCVSSAHFLKKHLLRTPLAVSKHSSATLPPMDKHPSVTPPQ